MKNNKTKTITTGIQLPEKLYRSLKNYCHAATCRTKNDINMEEVFKQAIETTIQEWYAFQFNNDIQIADYRLGKLVYTYKVLMMNNPI